MPRRRVFNFHDDPKHGWLEVKFTTLRNHGIKPDWFTEYSYFDEDKGVVYLEQDNDAAKLLRWYDSQGYRWAMRENIWPGLAPIRNLPRLDPKWPAWPDHWLPIAEKQALAVAEHCAKLGDARQESRRVTQPLHKKLWAMRKEAGLPERQERDKLLSHHPIKHSRVVLIDDDQDRFDLEPTLEEDPDDDLLTE